MRNKVRDRTQPWGRLSQLVGDEEKDLTSTGLLVFGKAGFCCRIVNLPRMNRLSVAVIAFVALVFPVHASAKLFHLRHSQGSTSTLRKRLHINDLITEPGTVEIDWANLYSYTSGNFTVPSAVKYTPAGNSFFVGRTEYSLAFDSVASSLDTGFRTTQFSDRVSLTATSILLDTTHFDVAIAPQATFFLRDASGARYGATMVAREDIGLNSMGATVGWTAATTSSGINPAGTWDFGVGYGRHLASKGALGHFTPHVNAVWERPTGFDGIASAFAGIEYQITERVAFDATGQRVGLRGPADRQVQVGMTINLGKPH